MTSSVSLIHALILLSCLAIAWSAGGAADVSLSRGLTKVELQSDERDTGEHPEQESSSDGDLKTLVLAKDSTFNVFLRKLNARNTSDRQPSIRQRRNWQYSNPCRMGKRVGKRNLAQILTQTGMKSDNESEKYSGEDILHIQEVAKKVLSKSGNLKTLILAKNSIFNFFPRKLDARISVSVNSDPDDPEDDDDDDYVSIVNDDIPEVSKATVDDSPVATNDLNSTTKHHQNNEVTISVASSKGVTNSVASSKGVTGSAAPSNDVIGSAAPSNDVTDSVECSNDVTETPTPERETTSVDIASQSEATSDVTTVSYETDSSSGDDDATVSEEEEVSGRIKENKYVYIRILVPVKNPEVGVPEYLVLDVDLENHLPEDESRKIVMSYNDQALSEQWQIDNETNSIRNRLQNLCIDFNERYQLIASPCNETSKKQQWLYDHDRHYLYNPEYNRTAEVVTDEVEVGQDVKLGVYQGYPGQFELGTLETENLTWTPSNESSKGVAESPLMPEGTTNNPVLPTAQPLYFVLENEETGLALSVFEERNRPGAKLVLANLTSPPGNGQLWYLDSKKVIRSKLNDYVIDSSHGTFLLEPFSYEAAFATSWTYFDRQIINLNDERQVMEPVSEGSSDELVLAARRRQDDRPGQKFKIIYTSPDDTVTPENITSSLPSIE